MHGLMSYQHFGRARSLHSDRAERMLGHNVATELWLKLCRYRPSGTNARPLRNDRALARARSLRSDQAEQTLGRYVATELARARSLLSGRVEHALGRCVATFFELLSDVSCFLRKAFRKK
ncbi:hypothetical protein F2Q68_00044174 [Brassica cretica]|uniref:Uncharacterized protein n=1 Tax=Brassica cretica TaxID=69181 RepID=A0A8S9LLA0_BRACR|nr:hypothetical protein F2Q68_00044174 [Brassica cretica]